MTQVQVQDASMGIADGGATIVKLSVVMVRGRFHDAVNKEIDAENIHPAIRDHLAKWAGLSSNASAVGILEALAYDNDNTPVVVREHLKRALELLR